MTTTQLVGFSNLDVREITSRVAERDCWGELPGDFVAVEESRDCTTIISSVVAASPYYYCEAPNGKLVHGRDFFDVFRRSCLPWEWNLEALRCLALLGHLLGNDTLHAKILRVPAASRLRYANGLLSLTHSEFWNDALAGESADLGRGDSLQKCIEALEGSFQDIRMQNPVISLSAGFDSRVLMALCLRNGIRPRAITLGPRHATDTQVAQRLASLVGWECERIELLPNEYLPVGSAVALATGGVKTATNWHTYLYPKRAGLNSSSTHIVGSNGEFARSYYFGGSNRVLPLSRVSAKYIVAYFLARIARRIVKFDKGWSFLSSRTNTITSIFERINAATSQFISSKNVLVALDGFYALERVRHFIGAGIACYRCHGVPVSPFLDARWLKSSVSLARTEKLSDRFHRAAIEQYAPQLLAIPFNINEVGATVGYNVFANVLNLEGVQRELRFGSEVVSDLVSAEAVERMVSRKSQEDLSLLMILRETAKAVAQVSPL